MSQLGYREVWADIKRLLIAEPKDLTTFGWWKKKFIKHYLPLCFAVALLWGLAAPRLGTELGKFHWGEYKAVQTVCVVYIFTISGLTLATKDVKSALRQWPTMLWGFFVISFATPILGFAMVKIPFSPTEFKYGHALFATVPTTITSGITQSAQAGGNRAAAIMLTIMTNLVGVVSVPYIFQWILSTVSPEGGEATKIKLDTVGLLIKLLVTIIVPLIFGKCLLEAPYISKYVVKFTTRWRICLNMSSSTALTIIVWMALSKVGHKVNNLRTRELAGVVLTGILLHYIFLAIVWAGVVVLRSPKPEKKSAVLMGCQKQIPMSITIINSLPPDAGLGNPALVSVPCILSHMCQLWLDAFLVIYWAYKWEKELEAEKMAAEKQLVDVVTVCNDTYALPNVKENPVFYKAITPSINLNGHDGGQAHGPLKEPMEGENAGKEPHEKSAAPPDGTGDGNGILDCNGNGTAQENGHGAVNGYANGQNGEHYAPDHDVAADTFTSGQTVGDGDALPGHESNVSLPDVNLHETAPSAPKQDES
eukprot:jgi/Mesvir1/13090/Mv06072-RA.2